MALTLIDKRKDTKMRTCNGQPWFTQLDNRAIHETHGTCVLVTNLAQLYENFRKFCQFTNNPENVLMVLKTNSTRALLSALAEAGAGADISTEEERLLALGAGIPPHKLSMYQHRTTQHGVHTLLKVLQEGGKVVLDSEKTIHALEAAIQPEHQAGKIFLRINYGIDPYGNEEKGYQKVVAHGAADSQFGLTPEKAMKVLQKTTLPICGLHSHIGTMGKDMGAFTLLMDEQHALADKINREGKHRITELNIGGGLGIGEGFPSLSEYVETMAAKKRPRFNYYAEPGNALFGTASVMLCQVLEIKNGHAIVDKGGLYKTTLQDFPIRSFCNGKQLPKGKSKICGPLCFAGDTPIKNVDISQVKEGDTIVLTECGSYVSTFDGNTFNGLASPPELLTLDCKIVGLARRKAILSENPAIGLHVARVDQKRAGQPIDYDSLASTYLTDTIRHDRVKVLSCIEYDHGKYIAEVETKSALPCISMPLWLIIGGSLTVATSQHSLGIGRKESDVLGPEANLRLGHNLPSNCQLKIQIEIGTLTKNCKGNRGHSWFNVIGHKNPDESKWQPLDPNLYWGVIDVLVVKKA